MLKRTARALKTSPKAAAVGAGLWLGLTGAAVAQTPTGSPAPATPAQGTGAVPIPPATAPAAPPGSWASSIKLNAQIEGGIVFNPDSPKNNFGQLFTDKSNQAELNQILLTASRVIDPKETGWDIGFKLQGLYGSDARYTHFLGELDRVTHDRYQFDIVEANVTVHMPVLTEGGIDLKLGQFSTPVGFETIDPSTNPFYSHSYIFNFGLPFKQTGGFAVVHATSMLDGYIGMDTGVNTSLGGRGDNNSSGAVLFGFGLNMLDGNLTFLALSHIGAENASRAVPNANHYLRYLNDAYLTYKATDKLSFTTEANFIRDDFARADGWGITQYGSYALTDTLTLNGRAEIWRDNKGFFVAAFPSNLDFVNAQEGFPTTATGGTRTTYSEFTAGVTYKPTLPAPVASLLIRPEIRYDRALNGTRPFNGGRSQGAYTFSSDFVLGF